MLARCTTELPHVFSLAPPPSVFCCGRECTCNGDVEKAGWELLTLKYLQGDPMFAGTALHLPPDLAPLAAAMAQAPEEVSRMAGIVGQQCRDHMQGSLVTDDTFWYLCKKGEYGAAACHARVETVDGVWGVCCQQGGRTHGHGMWAPV